MPILICCNFSQKSVIINFVFNNISTSYNSVSAFDSAHFVVVYRDEGNSNYGTAIIGTVSGSSISYGSEYVFNNIIKNISSQTRIEKKNFDVV